MKMQEIITNLEQVPLLKPALKDLRGSTIFLVVHDPKNDNNGYDLSLSDGRLRITKFQRDPYRTFDIMTGCESLSHNQRGKVRQYLIKNYFPELSYLLN